MCGFGNSKRVYAPQAGNSGDDDIYFACKDGANKYIGDFFVRRLDLHTMRGGGGSYESIHVSNRGMSDSDASAAVAALASACDLHLEISRVRGTDDRIIARAFCNVLFVNKCIKSVAFV